MASGGLHEETTRIKGSRRSPSGSEVGHVEWAWIIDGLKS